MVCNTHSANGTGTKPTAKSNGHANGHTNGSANGHANGLVNGPSKADATAYDWNIQAEKNFLAHGERGKHDNFEAGADW